MLPTSSVLVQLAGARAKADFGASRPKVLAVFGLPPVEKDGASRFRLRDHPSSAEHSPAIRHVDQEVCAAVPLVKTSCPT